MDPSASVVTGVDTQDVTYTASYTSSGVGVIIEVPISLFIFLRFKSEGLLTGFRVVDIDDGCDCNEDVESDGGVSPRECCSNGASRSKRPVRCVGVGHSGRRVGRLGDLSLSFSPLSLCLVVFLFLIFAFRPGFRE